VRHRRLRRGLLVATAACAGCAQWPQWSHLPDESDGIDAPDDPGALVEREWVEFAEGGDLPDETTAPPPIPLDFEHGGLLTAGLSGVGWNDLAAPVVIDAPGCNDAEAPRNPEVIPGDWAGDVDVIVVVAPEDGQLCAEVRLGSDQVGWDLLLARLDGCGVPEEFVEGDEGPLGWDRGGPGGRWDAPVEAGVAYAVLFAGYWPTDLAATVGYSMGVSLVVPGDEGASPCPLLPEGT
jgi:hypothetical protein